MADMSEENASLGAAQETLFIPLAGRARESGRRRPLLRDPKAVEMHQRQHTMAARRGLDARWQWVCDDPRSLESLGLEVMESTTFARPPRPVRDRLTVPRRLALALSVPLVRRTHALTLFRAQPRGE
jgi:hypothetical protein